VEAAVTKKDDTDADRAIDLEESELLRLQAALAQRRRDIIVNLRAEIRKLSEALSDIHGIANTATTGAGAALDRIVSIAKQSVPVSMLDATVQKKQGLPVKGNGNSTFTKLMMPSAALATIVGAGPITRVDVTKLIWSYIKDNKLQDVTNRRLIKADARLEKIFGGKRVVSMFEMTKMLSNHLA
jgi:upstream activation factor subunit UAF30